MEKTVRETQDFMNVESFSQLPFIRPAPVKEKGIRLFGKDFGSTITIMDDESDSADRNHSQESANDGDNRESSRKFECHYCFRNFPTSQALGGHQNAHKRERQLAKRAHLQSAAMVHGSYYAFHRPPLRPSMAVMNYYHHQLWNSNTSTTTSSYATTNPRLYGNAHGSSSSPRPPINGCPLSLRRIPAIENSATVDRDRCMHPHPFPLFFSDNLKPSSVVGGSSSQTPYVYDVKSSLKDHVSLDLRL